MMLFVSLYVYSGSTLEPSLLEPFELHALHVEGARSALALLRSKGSTPYVRLMLFIHSVVLWAGLSGPSSRLYRLCLDITFI